MLKLTERAQFLAVQQRGRRSVLPALTLEWLAQIPAPPSKSDTTKLDLTAAPFRVGFTATRKLGGAVVRNRAKRWLRAAIQWFVQQQSQQQPLPQGDLVLVARTGTLTTPFTLLCAQLKNGVDRLCAPL